MLWRGAFPGTEGVSARSPQAVPSSGQGKDAAKVPVGLRAHQHRLRGCNVWYWGICDGEAQPPRTPPVSHLLGLLGPGKISGEALSRADDMFLGALIGERCAKSISLELSGPDSGLAHAKVGC